MSYWNELIPDKVMYALRKTLRLDEYISISCTIIGNLRVFYDFPLVSFQVHYISLVYLHCSFL